MDKSEEKVLSFGEWLELRARQRRKTMRVLKELIAAEPLLVQLIDDILAVRDDGSAPAFCFAQHWYGKSGLEAKKASFKWRLTELVGWYAQGTAPVLRTQEAYDLAYQTLCNLLPDCRGNCICL